MEKYDVDGFWINYSRQLLEKVEVSEDLASRAKLVREWFGNEYAPDIALAKNSRETLTNLKKKGYLLGLIFKSERPAR